MKNLKMVFFMNRDKHTESMKPMIISTLARAIFFPDGKTLLEKWEKEIKSSIAIVHTEEITESAEGSSFKWSCTTFGDKKYQLSAHFRPSIANNPTIISGDESTVQKSITIIKKDASGNITEEVIPYGSSAGGVKQYRYAFPLPTEFANGRTVNFNNASITISEGHESDFIKFHTFHNCFCEYSNGHLFVYVDHFNGMDAVDMSGLPYVTEDLNIMIDGLFI